MFQHPKPVSDTFEIHVQKDFWYDGYTILKSDGINNMDHMRISGIEPSSVIIIQTKYRRNLKWDGEITSKTLQAKRDGAYNKPI